MQVVPRLLEGEDGQLKVRPDHLWQDCAPIGPSLAPGAPVQPLGEGPH